MKQGLNISKYGDLIKPLTFNNKILWDLYCDYDLTLNGDLLISIIYQFHDEFRFQSNLFMIEPIEELFVYFFELLNWEIRYVCL